MEKRSYVKELSLFVWMWQIMKSIFVRRHVWSQSLPCSAECFSHSKTTLTLFTAAAAAIEATAATIRQTNCYATRVSKRHNRNRIFFLFKHKIFVCLSLSLSFLREEMSYRLCKQHCRHCHLQNVRDSWCARRRKDTEKKLWFAGKM